MSERELESKVNETIAGYICEKLDRLPVVGDSIETGNFIFTVTEMDKRRISKIHCEKIESIEEEKSEFNESAD